MSWYCAQIGAREHFSIPRAILRKGELGRLVTDFWSPAIGGIRLFDRYHDELPDRYVIAENPWARKLFNRKSYWSNIEKANAEFGRFAANKLRVLSDKLPQPVFVFSYSYGARELFSAAKDLGFVTILGQVDPGRHEIEQIKRISLEHGLRQPCEPTESYWQSWWEEIDLADKIIVNSQWSYDALRKQRVQQDKLVTIPLIYENYPGKECEVQLKHDNSLTVLFLGQVIVRKGVVELIQAMQSLRNEPVKWLVVGPGDAELIARIEAVPNATYVGPVSQKSAGSYYRQADVFILPTHSDGFAITQLEAFAHGVPVIASRNCGEVVEHGVTGLLLDSVDCDSISDAVRKVLNDTQLLMNFRQNIDHLDLPDLEWLGEQLISIAR